MKRNILLTERCVRWLVGTVLLAWAFAGGPTWAYLGFYPLVTGSWGYCPIYRLLKIKAATSSSDK